MHQLLIALFCSLLGLACVPHPSPGPVPPPPGPRSDAGGVTCADACQHVLDMQCAWAQPTPDGHTCLDVCRSAEESGVVAWNVGCVFQASTCGEADRCR